MTLGVAGRCCRSEHLAGPGSPGGVDCRRVSVEPRTDRTGVGRRRAGYRRAPNLPDVGVCPRKVQGPGRAQPTAGSVSTKWRTRRGRSVTTSACQSVPAPCPLVRGLEGAFVCAGDGRAVGDVEPVAQCPDRRCEPSQVMAGLRVDQAGRSGGQQCGVALDCVLEGEQRLTSDVRAGWSQREGPVVGRPAEVPQRRR
jgi:hypothetical protein